MTEATDALRKPAETFLVGRFTTVQHLSSSPQQQHGNNNAIRARHTGGWSFDLTYLCFWIRY